MEKHQDNFELEEMKQQIRLLKEKLAKEAIVNEKMIMQSIREKLGYIKRKIRSMYILVPFALIYCNLFFISTGYSWMFCVVTSLFLIVAPKEISTGNLINISQALIRMNRLGLKWLYFGLPFAALWMVWFLVESYPKEGGETICIGGGVGFVVGAVMGLLHLNNVRRKAKDAIREIEAYTRTEE
ncbi:hypothetical protein [uncultured Bacteroides sp.]|uniref:hypothetical protein n=1 Tax=uncultured Bacteroides sp. TaxID=162156 RepID=UPI0026346BA8|nr:hypothetical protein [uncultured Bacteroides sp.]